MKPRFHSHVPTLLAGSPACFPRGRNRCFCACLADSWSGSPSVSNTSSVKFRTTSSLKKHQQWPEKSKAKLSEAIARGENYGKPQPEERPTTNFYELLRVDDDQDEEESDDEETESPNSPPLRVAKRKRKKKKKKSHASPPDRKSVV